MYHVGIIFKFKMIPKLLQENLVTLLLYNPA